MQTAKTIGSEIRAHLVLGLPLVGSQVAQILIGMTDTFMLGWYDVEALAGLVLATSIYFALLLFGAGFGFAVMPLVAAAAERGEEDHIRRVTRMGLWASTGFFLVFLPLMLFSGPILRAMGQEAAVAQQAATYLRIMGVGLLPALGIFVLRSYLSALEMTRVVLYTTLAAAAVNVVLNYALIFGNLGAPEMGIAGAALASLIVVSLNLLLLGVVAVRKFPSHRLFHRLWRPDFETLRGVTVMGLQIGVTALAEVGLFSAASVMMGWLGAVPLAAHGVASQITSVAFMVQVGLSQAATVRAGRALSRDDMDGLRMGARAVLVLAVGWAVTAAVMFLVVPEFLTGLFIDPVDPLRGQIIATGSVLLAVAALFQIVDGVQVMVMALLRGMTDTKRPMFIAAASYWLVGAPAGLVLGFGVGLEGIGVWLGLTLGLTCAALFLSLRLRRLIREKVG
ncbi:MAG: MATE family efflux transporter [Rhodobacterales bacterium]|nr:MAG: MATE family efflux transporter [Rhodobacterales bacterium]